MASERTDKRAKLGLNREDAFRIGRLDAHGQAALVRAGDLPPEGLVEAAFLRIDALNPDLNTLTYTDRERALDKASQAGGPMAGVPWIVKDGMDYPGMPYRAGSRSKKNASPAWLSFPYTEAFDAEGLVVIGKSNAPEFGLLPTTEPLLYGPARNPWDPLRTPGGSSGGSAVAVASGIVPVAHGADGGGSIRIPASCCGLVGLKPGRGTGLRARPHHLIEDLLACDILLSRSVRDVEWSLRTGAAAPDLIGEAALPDRPLRIAVCAGNLWGDQPEPDVAIVIEQTAQLCASLGHEVVSEMLPVAGEAVMRSFQTIWAYMARELVTVTQLAQNDAPLEDLLEPWTLNLARWSQTQTAADVENAFAQVGLAGSALEAMFERYDLLLTPVLRRPSLRIGELSPSGPFEDMMHLMYDYVSYTPLHNLTGHPAISLPVFTASDGLPLGSMFAAARGRENLLLGLAYQLEAAAEWQTRWPALSVGGIGDTGKSATRHPKTAMG
ncbi:amidase [Hyphomonas sp. NPDC076900]|uniref:amidase n=1 Tax=unclassified Hyphomonas TaxID=2630699 RepID=UPI003D0130CD